jgi:hypothetical protein
LALLALAVAPVANAATSVWIGAGSSAQWQEYALATVNDPALGATHHYTIKGKCSGVNCAQAFDSRKGAGGTVNDAQGGNIWITWNAAETKIWAYLSVDSVVGNRLFFATPRATLELSTGVEATGSSMNLISPFLFAHGDSGKCGPGGATESTCDASALPANIYTALNNTPLSAALTDIRPEDALFASKRANCAGTPTLSCLGYGITGSPVGTPIASAFSTSNAEPVSYAISGSDPVSGDAVPAYKTFPVGAQPIIIITNRTDAAGLGQAAIKNATHAELQTIFSGANCSASQLGGTAHAIYPILREPLSGTMNTFEFTNMTSPTTLTGSQETGIGTHNPVDALACTAGGGARYRGIGTGEIVGGGSGGPASPGGVQNIADSIGYVFFSYGNVSKLAGSASYGYLTLDGVDPLTGQPGLVAGRLPLCSTSSPITPCPETVPNSTFKNLRNGTYRSWSFLRAVTDASGKNLSNTENIVAAAQANINKYVPDFVPYIAAGGDAGMKYYRSHFTQSGVAGNNGLPFTEPSNEKGGDVGGCIEATTTNVLNAHENTSACSK